MWYNDINWQSMDDKKIQFLLTEIKGRMKSVNNSINLLNNKAHNLITTLFPIITIGFSYILIELNNLKIDIIIAGLIFFISLTISTILLIKTYKIKQIYPANRDVKELLLDKTSLYQKSYNDFICWYILSMQSPIEENQNISNQKSKQINLSINIIFIGLFMALLYLLFKFYI